MLFRNKVSPEVFDCMVSAEKYGRESRRGYYSKAQFKQKSSKLSFPHRDRRKAKSPLEKRKRRWVEDYVGKDCDLPVDVIVQRAEEAGLIIEVQFHAAGTKCSFKATNSRWLDLFMKERDWKPVLREILDLN